MEVKVIQINNDAYQVEITKKKAIVVKADNEKEAIKKAIKKV